MKQLGCDFHMSSHKFCLFNKDNDFGTVTDYYGWYCRYFKLRICEEHTYIDIPDHINAISIWLHSHKFLFTEGHKIVLL